eukprot:scpid61731/ scgid35384/ 
MDNVEPVTQRLSRSAKSGWYHLRSSWQNGLAGKSSMLVSLLTPASTSYALLWDRSGTYSSGGSVWVLTVGAIFNLLLNIIVVCEVILQIYYIVGNAWMHGYAFNRLDVDDGRSKPLHIGGETKSTYAWSWTRMTLPQTLLLLEGVHGVEDRDFSRPPGHCSHFTEAL